MTTELGYEAYTPGNDGRGVTLFGASWDDHRDPHVTGVKPMALAPCFEGSLQQE